MSAKLKQKIRRQIFTVCLAGLMAVSTLSAQFLDEDEGEKKKRGFIGITSLRWVDDQFGKTENFQVSVDIGLALDEDRSWYFATVTSGGQLYDARLAYIGVGLRWYALGSADHGLHLAAHIGYARSSEFFSSDVNAPVGNGVGSEVKLGFSFETFEGWPPVVIGGIVGIYDIHRTFRVGGLQVGLLL